MANNAFLTHSRSQESAADHAALRYLKITEQTAKGLLEFLMTLKKKETLSTTKRTPYFQTHPLTDDRIEFVHEHIKRSIDISHKESSINIARHDRMVGKLIGFLYHPSKTFAHYPNPDASIAAKYARIIGLHQNAETKKALILLNELIENSPQDPYFWELKGQLLFEAGQPTKARVAYEKALFIEKYSPLIRHQLAKVELAIGTTAANLSALKHLKKTIRSLPNSQLTWHNLAIAQGRTGNRAMANLSLAEAALLRHIPKLAITHAVRAKRKLKQGSPSYQRAIDIIELSDRLYKNQSK
jgi:predicted Zn-dependent protease